MKTTITILLLFACLTARAQITISGATLSGVSGGQTNITVSNPPEVGAYEFGPFTSIFATTLRANSLVIGQ